VYVIDIQMKDLQHSNVRSFIGACLEDTDVILVNEHCSRGSLLVYSSQVTFNYRRVEVLTRLLECGPMPNMMAAQPSQT